MNLKVFGDIQVAIDALNREASLIWEGREGNSREAMLKQKDM